MVRPSVLRTKERRAPHAMVMSLSNGDPTPDWRPATLADLAGPAHDADAVTLADVQAVTAALLHTFGPTTPLETIIKHLVAQDLREQIEQRQVGKSLGGVAA